MASHPSYCTQKWPDLESSVVVLSSLRLFFHVSLSGRLAFIPIGWLKPWRTRVCSHFWYDPYPEQAFEHCYGKGCFTLSCVAIQIWGGKCSITLLKETRWWFSDIYPISTCEGPRGWCLSPICLSFSTHVYKYLIFGEMKKRDRNTWNI